MGDGEFVGGGSVRWRVRNSISFLSLCSPKGARGKDLDPKDDDGMFRVIVNGKVVAQAPVHRTKVQVQWGRDALKPLPDAPKDSARASKSASSARKPAASRTRPKARAR
jgi:hypothetical protein